MVGRFPEHPAREEVAVAEGGLAVDQDDVEPLLEREVLEAVVEQEGIGAEMFHRVEAALHPVAVDQHHHVPQVLGQHVGLVARAGRIEQELLPVRDDTGRRDMVAAPDPVAHPFGEGDRRALVAAAEDRHLPPRLGEAAGQLLDDGGLAGPADREVADADHQAAEGVDPRHPLFIEPEAERHDPAIEEREEVEEAAQHRRAAPEAAAQDHVDRVAFEVFEERFHAVGIGGMGKVPPRPISGGRNGTG